MRDANCGRASAAQRRGDARANIDLRMVLTTQVMSENDDGLTGWLLCATCERERKTSYKLTLRGFVECPMDEETLQSIEKGKSQMRRGRPSIKSKSQEAVLSTEISDEMFWNLVKRSQLRPSEEPSFDHVDFFTADGENRSPEDEEFIDGLIRFPSFSMLNSEMSGRGDGLAMGIESSSPEESVEHMRKQLGGSKQSFGDVQGFDLPLSRAASGSLVSPYSQSDVVMGAKTTSKSKKPRERTGTSLPPVSKENKGKPIGRPPKKPFPSSAAKGSSSSFPSSNPNDASKLPGGSGRKEVLERYHSKRKARSYGKTIHYEARKIRAAMRVRIGGRFAKATADDKQEDFKGPIPA